MSKECRESTDAFKGIAIASSVMVSLTARCTVYVIFINNIANNTHNVSLIIYWLFNNNNVFKVIGIYENFSTTLIME
jgi:hypothetical protein